MAIIGFVAIEMHSLCAHMHDACHACVYDAWVINDVHNHHAQRSLGTEMGFSI